MAYRPQDRHPISGRVAIVWCARPIGADARPLVFDADTGAFLPYKTLIPGRIDDDNTDMFVELRTTDSVASTRWYEVTEMRLVHSGTPTINEQRAALGLPPFEMPEADRPMWLTESGVTFEPPK